MKIIITIFILTLCFSCQTRNPAQKYVLTSFDENSCLSAYHEKKADNVEKVYKLTKQAFGTGASYLLTGAAYTTDVIINVVGGVAVGVVVCAPVIALEATNNGTSNASGKCVSQVGKAIGEETMTADLGKKTYQETKSWRCQDVDRISQALRRVSSCFKKEGNTQKAKEQLQTIIREPHFYKCLSDKEKLHLEGDLVKIKS